MPLPKCSVQATLAILVTLGFFGVLLLVLLHGLPADASNSVLILLGSLGTVFGGVYGYYFGSSMGSANKEETIKTLAGSNVPLPPEPAPGVITP